MDNLKVNLFVLALVATAICKTTSATGLECIITEPPLTRTFSSYQEYRSNRKPFTPHQSGFQGNHVNFRFDTIDRLMTSMFKTFESFHIIKLNLTRKGIQRIDNDAFSGLSCLHFLDLSHNNIADISEGVFRGLGRLRDLDLAGNQIGSLPPNVFVHLESLNVLNMANNYVKSVPDPMAFFNLSRLEVLNLNGNGMDGFPEGLHYLKSLKVLRMNSNVLKTLDVWKVGNVSNSLEVVDLGSNAVESINFTTNGTKAFTAMKALNLSDNSLYNIDVHGLRASFPVMRRVYIDGNAWECHVLSIVIHELGDAGISFHDNDSSSVDAGKKDEAAQIGPGLSCRSGAVLYQPLANGSFFRTTGESDRLREAARNWTGLAQSLREILYADHLNTRLTRDVLRDLASLQNVLVLATVFAVLYLVAGACVRGGLCTRCVHYAGDGRVYRQGEARRDRRSRNHRHGEAREREALLAGDASAYVRI